MHVDEVSEHRIAEAVDRADPAGDVAATCAGIEVDLHGLTEAKPRAGTRYDLGPLPFRALQPHLGRFERIGLPPSPGAQELWRGRLVGRGRTIPAGLTTPVGFAPAGNGHGRRSSAEHQKRIRLRSTGSTILKAA